MKQRRTFLALLALALVASICWALVNSNQRQRVAASAIRQTRSIGPMKAGLKPDTATAELVGLYAFDDYVVLQFIVDVEHIHPGSQYAAQAMALAVAASPNDFLIADHGTLIDLPWHRPRIQRDGASFELAPKGTSYPHSVAQLDGGVYVCNVAFQCKGGMPDSMIWRMGKPDDLLSLYGVEPRGEAKQLESEPASPGHGVAP